MINKPMTEEEVTINLVNSIVALSRIIKERDLDTPEIEQALRKLYLCDDLMYLVVHAEGLF